MITALALAAGLGSVPREFGDYLGLKDDSFGWRVEDRSEQRLTLLLTSQTWRGIPWHHTLALVQPKELAHKGAAVLVVTGWVINPADMAEAQAIADESGMAAAVLFDIPNQPLYGLREDELVAYTFAEYIETRDATWPLLFPMAKSAIRAMDALESATKDSANPLKRFVVTGASKRGWTAWFVGASGDTRVAGIAPMIVDNLNLAAQMPHQLRLWGKYSEMIDPYTRHGLQQKMNTPEDGASPRSSIPIPIVSASRRRRLSSTGPTTLTGRQTPSASIGTASRSPKPSCACRTPVTIKSTGSSRRPPSPPSRDRPSGNSRGRAWDGRTEARS